jgi:hypothetical protein
VDLVKSLIALPHGPLSENVQALFSALSDDPSGGIWIVASLNLLTVACGMRNKIWQAKAFRVLVSLQLLVVPIVAAVGFHYAIQPPA